MMLLTKANRRSLPKLYSQENVKDPTAFVKFFSPSGRGTWYALEFDGEDRFFGWVASPLGSDCDELGYFSLAELKAVRCPIRLGARVIGHLPIERDYYFKPTRLSEVKKLH